jgi:four helix bundle protein
MTPEELRQRTAAFAKEIRLFAKPLFPPLISRDAAVQLVRAASSAAANYRASTRARSHAEFTAKLGVVLEESDEALFWLEHLRDCELIGGKTTDALMSESQQLVAIFTASATTARARQEEKRNGRNVKSEM